MKYHEESEEEEDSEAHDTVPTLLLLKTGARGSSINRQQNVQANEGVSSVVPQVAPVHTVTVAHTQAIDADVEGEHTESETEFTEPTHAVACVGTVNSVVGVNAGEVAIDLLHIISDIQQTILDLGAVSTELTASAQLGRNNLQVFLQRLGVSTMPGQDDPPHTSVGGRGSSVGGRGSRRKRDYNFS